MRRRISIVAMGIGLVLVLGAIAYVLAQPAPAEAPAGGWGPGMVMPGWPPAPPAVVAVEDGVVYVACDGTLTAFEAKTLRSLGEATYWERPDMAQ